MSFSRNVLGSISVGLGKGDFEWVINNCFDAIFVKALSVTSPTFYFGSFPWYVRMYEYGSSEGNVVLLSLYKEDSEKPYGYVAVSFDMIFLGMEVKKGYEIGYFSKDSKMWRWNHSIPKKHLLDHWTKASNKCCKLIVRIRLRNVVPACDEDLLLKLRLKGKEVLSQNYRDMLLDGEDHDLVLKVKDKVFKAHCNIMKSRCPVFKSMLSHEMLEKNSGIVHIPDCDPLAFEQFLLYIYTGELHELDESTVLGLYFIADKYEIENLREECSAIIKKSLSVHVICDVVKLALDHSDSALLEFATKYLVNNAKEIFETAEWMSFMKENLIQANKLIIKAVEKSSYCYVCRSKDGASDLE